MNKINYANAFNEVSSKIMINNFKKITINNDNEIVKKYQDYALTHPTLNVEDVLKKVGVTYNQYLNLSKSHLNIPQVRLQRLGSMRILTQDQKDELRTRLTKGTKQRSVPHSKSKKRKVIGKGVDEKDDVSGMGINEKTKEDYKNEARDILHGNYNY